jgi:HAD superfamily hydrolase (TIGR01490 family)
LYKSVRLEKAEPEWQAVAEDLLSEQREDVVELLRKHQSEGHMVVLVSGTFQPVLRIMAGRLGVQHFVGTPLEEKDGRYTGRLSAPMYFAGEKARQLKMYVERNGFDVDMTASYAYADRMYDRAFLEMVGHPVAVYPDEPLLAHAREKGWQVIGEMSA